MSRLTQALVCALAATVVPSAAVLNAQVAASTAPKSPWSFTPSHASQDNVAHRVSANLRGNSGRTAGELTNSLVRIDGSDQGPIFDVAKQGDIPAVGGIPLRDRRDAMVLRNGFKLTQTMGRWFLRPVFSAYKIDFLIEQRVRTGALAGYEH